MAKIKNSDAVERAVTNPKAAAAMAKFKTAFKAELKANKPREIEALKADKKARKAEIKRVKASKMARKPETAKPAKRLAKFKFGAKGDKWTAFAELISDPAQPGYVRLALENKKQMRAMILRLEDSGDGVQMRVSTKHGYGDLTVNIGDEVIFAAGRRKDQFVNMSINHAGIAVTSVEPKTTTGTSGDIEKPITTPAAVEAKPKRKQGQKKDPKLYVQQYSKIIGEVHQALYDAFGTNKYFGLPEVTKILGDYYKHPSSVASPITIAMEHEGILSRETSGKGMVCKLLQEPKASKPA